MNYIRNFLCIVMLSFATPLAASDLLTTQPYDRVLGNEDAPVTIIEYMSLSCSHCANFHNDVFPALQEKYIDTGKVRMIVRNYPINPPALKGAMLTMCVPQDKYYTFLKVLLSMQSKWAMSMDFLANLKQIAKVGGVSQEAFDACMNNKELEDKVISIAMEAKQQLNIEATPSFLVNGEMIKGGRSIEEFSKIIDAKLAE